MVKFRKTLATRNQTRPAFHLSTILRMSNLDMDVDVEVPEKKDKESGKDKDSSKKRFEVKKVSPHSVLSCAN